MKTMAEVLMLHFPNVESGWPGGKFRFFCDATDCDFVGTTDLYGIGMSAFIAHQSEALAAAGYGPVKAAGAQALRDAAERFSQRSDTLYNTMREMTASREYGLEDVVRYGAYAAEANTTATWLRTQAAKAATP